MKENLPQKPDDSSIVRLLETELESRERITKAAETEIGRVWDAYSKIAKLSAGFFVLVVGVVAFLGWKTPDDIRTSANSAAQKEVEKVQEQVKAELDRQLQKDEIQKIVRDYISHSGAPIISSNFLGW